MTVGSHCSATALWSQPSFLPVAHKPAQPSSKGPLGPTANYWTEIPTLGSVANQLDFGHETSSIGLQFPTANINSQTRRSSADTLF